MIARDNCSCQVCSPKDHYPMKTLTILTRIVLDKTDAKIILMINNKLKQQDQAYAKIIIQKGALAAFPANNRAVSNSIINVRKHRKLK